jgi:hypothetical protein
MGESPVLAGGLPRIGDNYPYGNLPRDGHSSARRADSVSATATVLDHARPFSWTTLEREQDRRQPRALGPQCQTLPGLARRYLRCETGAALSRQFEKAAHQIPEVYVCDSGRVHALLRIRSLDDLQGHPSLGASWEGFVMEQIAGLLAGISDIFFFRTSAGAEIDLLFLDSRNRPVAIEVKYSLSPGVTRRFWSAYEDLSCQAGFVIYPGDEMFPLGRNVFALPIRDLEKEMIRAAQA